MWVRCFADGLVFEADDLETRLSIRRPKSSDDDFVVEVLDKDKKYDESAPKVAIEGIFGVYEMLSGPRVALVLESEPLFEAGDAGDATDLASLRRVTKIGLAPVFMDTKYARRLRSSSRKEAALHERLLCRALTEQPFVFARSTAAATRSAARRQIVPNDAPWDGADPRFLWNRRVVDPLTKRAGKGALDFCLACASAVATVGSETVPLLVLSRIAADNASTRLGWRGLGEEDKLPTNFIETETVVFTNHQPFRTTMLRSSLPLKIENLEGAETQRTTLEEELEVSFDDDDDDEASTSSTGGLDDDSESDSSSDDEDDLPSGVREDYKGLAAFVADLTSSYLRRQVTLVDMLAVGQNFHRRPRARQRLKKAASRLASLELGGRLRHVVLCAASDEDLCCDAELRDPAANILLFTGCEELDQLDEAQCKAAKRALILQDLREPPHIIPECFGGELERAWKSHADSLAFLRARSSSLFQCTSSLKKLTTWLYRDVTSALVEASRLDGLDLLLGRYIPDPHSKAVTSSYPFEKVDNFAVRVLVLFTLLFCVVYAQVLEGQFVKSLAAAAWVAVECLLIFFAPKVMDRRLFTSLARNRCLHPNFKQPPPKLKTRISNLVIGGAKIASAKSKKVPTRSRSSLS